jgi:hypothetical protein
MAAKLETLSEIEEREHRVRERARTYEVLLGEEARWRKEVTRLEEKLASAENAAGRAALAQIHELTGKVPGEIVTRGGSLAVPGGVRARDVLMLTAGDALNTYDARQQKNAEALAQAQAKLAQAEAALAKFVAEAEAAEAEKE